MTSGITHFATLFLTPFYAYVVVIFGYLIIQRSNLFVKRLNVKILTSLSYFFDTF